MKLVEHEGKTLLSEHGIPIPESLVHGEGDAAAFCKAHGTVMLKAQVIGTGRMKAGLILEADAAMCEERAQELLGKQYRNVPVTQILIEEKLDASEEHYLSIIYDTRARQPAVVYLPEGGIEVEHLAAPPTLHPFSPTDGLSEDAALRIANGNTALADIMRKAAACFLAHECLELEINPLLKTADGYIAADAKITIDDAAIPRLARFKGRTDHETFLTERERMAREVDRADHRGVAGRTYVELDGDIAVMASGGGGSLTAMDTIIQAGARPANYVEYSGNPTREKVAALTSVVLSKPGLRGCLVVGGRANFTDVYETLMGIMDVIRERKPTYPIVIRRAGPRDKEAFAQIRRIAQDEGYDITLMGEETPISKAAHLIAEKTHD